MTRFVCFFAAILACVSLSRADEPTRRIFAGGGRTFSVTDRDQLLLKYLFALTGKKEPTVVYLPTATGDSATSLVTWYEVANELDCRPRHLRLFDGSSHMRNIEGQLLGADAIVVGGGNTMNMLAVWKAHGVDAILKKAYDRGVILSGESAGMICWFDQGVSDSRQEKLSVVDGLRYLSGSSCPHYNLPIRKETYWKMIESGEIKDGIALDEHATGLYENGKLVRVVSAQPKARGYYVRKSGGKVVEEPIATEYLKATKK